MPWSKVKGQEFATHFLGQALERNRIAHAYMFVGPSSVGKRWVAHLFVQALLCPNPQGVYGCGECSVCRRVERGVHPDLHLVQPDGDVVRIEQVRALQNTLSLKPFEAQRKAAIMDGADLMTVPAQNALLKVLEEPPGDAVLILVAANPSKLLPTVWSRCQIVRFQPLPRSVVVDTLVAHGVPSAKAALLAAMTEGRLGEALAAADKDVVALRDRVADWVEALAHPGTGLQAVLRIGHTLESERESVQESLSLFLLWLRDMLLAKEGVLDAIANQDVKERVSACAQSVDVAGLAQAMKAVAEAKRRLEASAGFRLTLDVMLTAVQRGLAS